MLTILIPVDFSEATEPAVEFVADVASKMDAQVDVLHVCADRDDPDHGWTAAKLKLDDIIVQLKKLGCVAFPLIVSGSPAESILQQIDEREPYMVVMGSHGHTAMHDLVIGSATHRVLRSGKCPLLIVPSPRPESWKPDPSTLDADAWSEYGYYPG
jgi:nucleotide-binding universal stress UspA family protein